MEHTLSATPLDAVLVVPRAGGVASDVWLRRNVAHDVIEMDGTSQEVWEADEVHGTVAGMPAAAELEADFDSLWEAFEQAGLTDRELVMRSMEAAERAMAQADFTALMTDTEV